MTSTLCASHAPAQLGVAHKEQLLVVPPCCHSRLLLPKTGNYWEHPGDELCLWVPPELPRWALLWGWSPAVRECTMSYVGQQCLPIVLFFQVKFPFLCVFFNFPYVLWGQSGCSGASGTDDTCAEVIPAWGEITELNSYLSFGKKNACRS